MRVLQWNDFPGSKIVSLMKWDARSEDATGIILLLINRPGGLECSLW
jgi:hypothetical protein